MLPLMEFRHIRGECLTADGLGCALPGIGIGATRVQREEEQARKLSRFIRRAYEARLGFREVGGIRGARRKRGTAKTDW